MIKALVFSKDRPLQLHSYLSSLTKLTSVDESDVSIIVPSMDDYRGVADTFRYVNWFQEEGGGFDNVFRKYTESLDDDGFTLFGCDDVVYIRPCGLNMIPMVLNKNPDLIGFSLRLGRNIYPRPMFEASGAVLTWAWPGWQSHFGYPFELMASVYRNSLIKEIVAATKSQIKSPNYLESYGVTYCIQNKHADQPKMAMFNTDSYALAFDINRVQHDFQNKFSGTQNESADVLKEKYTQGYLIDWTNAFGIKPQDCFVGNRYFTLVKQNES
jgi:hypothetical protein